MIIDVRTPKEDPIEESGWQAFHSNLWRASNPYVKLTDEYYRWDAGWVHAYECSH